MKKSDFSKQNKSIIKQVSTWLNCQLVIMRGRSISTTDLFPNSLAISFSGFIFKPYNNEVEKIVVHNNRNGQLFIVKITIKNT